MEPHSAELEEGEEVDTVSGAEKERERETGRSRQKTRSRRRWQGLMTLFLYFANMILTPISMKSWLKPLSLFSLTFTKG